MNLENFICAFIGYIQSNGHDVENWSMGIATDARKRLFKEHKVKEYYGKYFADDALTRENAIETITALLNEFELENVSDFNDTTGTQVYIYKNK